MAKIQIHEPYRHDCTADPWDYSAPQHEMLCASRPFQFMPGEYDVPDALAAFLTRAGVASEPGGTPVKPPPGTVVRIEADPKAAHGAKSTEV